MGEEEPRLQGAGVIMQLLPKEEPVLADHGVLSVGVGRQT